MEKETKGRPKERKKTTTQGLGARGQVASDQGPGAWKPVTRGQARDQGQKRSGVKDKRPETRGQGPNFEAEKSEKDVPVV
jgi:hypothetical protein